MSKISLYNTSLRAKAPFVPIDPANVRMYVCGPTVYDRAHIGNARPVVVFDTLFRLLRHAYGADHVTYVRNFTDIDDKIIARSRESGRPIEAITAETIGWYHADMGALGVLHPTHEPRATAFVPQMVAMIATLIERGHAYAAEGHVLFSVASYPAYGRFSNRSLDEMQAGARVEVAPYKRDPMDFVLWKPSEAGQPGWPSPWGLGRPGWHIECSAMSAELLGPSFDIHGGGIDLVFPHHENEIAQSRCAHPEGDFAHVWMHNGFLNVEGEKMSKSLGNFFTVRDLLERGIPGEVIRFVLLSTHYRQPIDWTEAKVREAEVRLRRWRAKIKSPDLHSTATAPAAFIEAISDDLNIPRAMSLIDGISYDSEVAGCLNFLGFSIVPLGIGDEHVMNRIQAIINARAKARRDKDFAKADAIRGFLEIAGVVVEDGVSPSWKIGFSGTSNGWLKVLDPVRDGKAQTSLAELLDLAREHRVQIVEDATGIQFAFANPESQSRQINTRFLDLAEREAYS